MNPFPEDVDASRNFAIPPPCPACASAQTIPIIYGLPGEELGRQAEEGTIALGGCVVSDDDPQWKCRACQHQWK